MSRAGWESVGIVSAIMLLASPGGLAAQDCERGDLRTWLGIGRFHCPGGICKVRGAIARTSSVPSEVVATHARSPHRYDFSVEPSLWNIDPDGPAGGKLEEGDVLVAVNDRAVTTAQASEELDELEPGEAVRLTVRRQSRLVDVTLTPTRSCERVWLSAGTSTEVPGPGRRVAIPRHPDRSGEERGRLVEALEAARVAAAYRTGPGFLGVAIRCGECVLKLSADVGGSQFRFEEYPEVVEVVEGSLAEQAGLRPGDVLTHVDGKDLRTDEGADHLARLILRPGERLEIRYLRDDTSRTGVAIYELEGGR